MKMKFANHSQPIKLFACCALACLLNACASNDTKVVTHSSKERLPLAETEQYLPVQERDELGQIIPYEAMPNPYTELRGRISKTAVTNYIEARRAFNSEQYDRAETILAALVVEEKKLGGPWVMRGDIALINENVELAVEHYAKAIEASPLNFNAYLRLAKAQRQLGLFTHAQNTYAVALAEWPDGPELHLNLGVLYDVYFNQPLKAQAHMEAYQLLNDEDNADAVTWLEEVKQRTGVASTLKIMGSDGNLELINASTSESESSVSNTETLSVTDSGLE